MTAPPASAPAQRPQARRGSFSCRLRQALLQGALMLGALMLGAPMLGACCAASAAEARPSVSAPTPAAVLRLDQLDHQARQTLRRIHDGGPFPFAKDAIVFGNYEHQLPGKLRGYYREYTVPTPGSRNRGAKRIVCGGASRSPDVCYYTHDHYASFQYIAR